MSITTVIRCENCGKVLRGKPDEGGTLTSCPKCKNKLVVPDAFSSESRRHPRVLTTQSSLALRIPESLSQGEEPALYCIAYTEVSPVEFALHRSTCVPLMDVSEGGMGFLVRTDEKARPIEPGYCFVVEIDFPILVQPVFVTVETRWLRPMSGGKLLRVGVQFKTVDESFKKVVKKMIEYLMVRTDAIDVEKWGMFV